MQVHIFQVLGSLFNVSWILTSSLIDNRILDNGVILDRICNNISIILKHFCRSAVVDKCWKWFEQKRQ